MHLALLCFVVFCFAGEARACYFEDGHGGGLFGREFELVRASGLCGMRGTCGLRTLRGICCLSFH